MVAIVAAFLNLAGIVVAYVVFIRANRADNARHREAMAADSKRHMEALEVAEQSRRADLEAQRLNQIEVKNRLVVTILAEIYRFHALIKITLNLQASANYTLEASTIFETVPDQIRYFRQLELIGKLVEYRDHLRRIEKAFITYNGIDSYGSIAPSSAGNIKGNWNHWWNESKRLNAEVRNLLVNEFEGELPKEFQTWQAN